MPFRFNVDQYSTSWRFPLIHSESETDTVSLHFAVGGESEIDSHGLIGILVSPGTEVELARGQLFTDPTDTWWGMWFDVGNVDGIAANPFDLIVYRDMQNDQKIRLSNITFTIEMLPFVSVVYPSGGTFCPDGFSTYGAFSGDDNLVDKVEIYSKGVEAPVQTNYNPYQTGQGFWTASFNGLSPAQSPYYIIAHGNENPSNPSLEFMTKAC